MKDRQITLPKPHAAQAQVIDQAKRFNVLACGRRWGKSLLGMDRIIQTALRGLKTAWFSPTYKNLADSWRELSTVLAPVITDRNQAEKRLELVGGGSLEFWSLDSAGDSARGRAYSRVVIDEAAIVPDLEHAWAQSIRPMLADCRGDAWFLSTPRGQNYFKALFDRGQDSERDDWMSWQMPTSANPFIDATEIEAARQDLTEAAFNQEYLALFVNWEGAVFRRVMDCATASALDGPEDDHTYIVGVDWGRSVDFTVFCVMDATTGAMVAISRSNQVDYVIQRARLVALYERWRPQTIIAEANSIGQPVIEALVREGLPVTPWTTTNASKAQAIEALALAFERGTIRILPDPVLLSELQAYQAEQLPSGLMRYGAPNGQHDDTVIALALCWQGAGGGMMSMPEAWLEYMEDDIKKHGLWAEAEEQVRQYRKYLIAPIA